MNKQKTSQHYILFIFSELKSLRQDLQFFTEDELQAAILQVRLNNPDGAFSQSVYRTLTPLPLCVVVEPLDFDVTPAPGSRLLKKRIRRVPLFERKAYSFHCFH